MDKFKELISRCKCDVFVAVNNHRSCYTTASVYLEEAKGHDCPPEIHPDVQAAMIASDTIVTVRFYPDTPAGFYEIWHYDLDAALDKALACFLEPISAPQRWEP